MGCPHRNLQHHHQPHPPGTTNTAAFALSRIGQPPAEKAKDSESAIGPLHLASQLSHSLDPPLSHEDAYKLIHPVQNVLVDTDWTDHYKHDPAFKNHFAEDGSILDPTKFYRGRF